MSRLRIELRMELVEGDPEVPDTPLGAHLYHLLADGPVTVVVTELVEEVFFVQGRDPGGPGEVFGVNLFEFEEDQGQGSSHLLVGFPVGGGV